MTGRRLYELLCDAHAERDAYYRNPDRFQGNRLGLVEELPAWPFLAQGERRMFNQIAARLKGVRR